MKQRKIRVLTLLLAAALLLSCLPVQALAAEEETGWFYLVADWNGGLLIEPERVPYTAEQTIYEAICAAGHTLAPNAGDVSQIDGRSGNFIRSDENGGYDLTRTAAEAGIRYICFVDTDGIRKAVPSEARQALIAAMAEYRQKRSDVKAAAKAEYDAACAGYCTADDAAAAALCEALTDAVERYEQRLDGEAYAVSFTDTNGVWNAGNLLTAENEFGLVYEDAGDGVLELPEGTYTVTMETAGSGMTGQITVPEQRDISVRFSGSDWLFADQARLSTEMGNAFADGEIGLTVTGRTLQAAVPDTYTSTLFMCWPYDTARLPKLTARYTPAGAARTEETEQSLDSVKSGVDGVLAAGITGGTVVYRASVEEDGGWTQYQDYTLVLRRTPTLQTLRLTNADGSPAALEFDEKTQTYTGTVIGQSADLTLVPSTAGCRLFVDGADVTAAGGCKVTASTGGNRTAITLKAGEETAEYTLVLYQAAASAVRIPVASADIQVTVRDRNGQKVRGQFNKTTKEYSFQLIPGQTYTYTAEDPGKPGCYSEYRFTAAAGGDTLKTATVKSGDWLTSLELAIDSKTNIALDRAFEPGQHTYEGTVADTLQAVYLKLDGDVESAVTTFSARYGMMTGTAKDGQETEVPIPAEKLGKNVLLNGLLLSRTGRGTVLTVRCSREESGVTYYQDYEITLRRSLSLEALNVSSGGQQQVLTYSGGSGYTSSVRDYTVTVPAAAADLTVTAQVYSGSGCYRDGRKNGYHVWLGDQELTPGEALAAELNGTAEAETVTLTVTNEFAEGVSSEYRILVQKAEPVYFTPELEPGSALLFVREELSGRRVWPDENGAYEISDGFLYRYLLTCAGYVGQSSTIGTIHAEDGTLLLRVDGDVALVEDGTASAKMTLTPAKENEALKMRPAQWADFRGTSYAADGTMGGSMGSNNTVLSVKTPVSVEKSTLYWANQLGSGFDSGATGCPLLVDDVLITYAGDTIYRIDPVSGEILASAKMERASSFAITPPAYAKGMVFIGLAGGTIQAFDARTLESLWVYHDPLTGQPNCPITICGDYLYTGFWRGETFDANFVCLSITDEDPTKDNEEKNACWYWTHKGGYYWAGAYACEDYVLVGADDGEDGYKKGNGELLLFDAKTGRLLDSWSEMPGDIRSSICYDEDTKAFYFTTKGGWFCSVQVEQGTDGWQLKKSSEWMMQLKNGSAEEPAMSTSTPTVYNGRAYVGVCGSSQFGAFSGHNITVIDLKEQKIAYHAETMGYPQTSGILTTAYEEDTGAVYVYFLDNITPGKLRVLKDSPGQSAPEYLTDEYGRETPYILFTPNKEEAQYAICTPVVDEYGVLYFKNDTAKMMAFGPSVELEITEQPAKTEYRVGETFDPTGMKVELVYANGQRRDVTKYVEWSQEALTEKDVEFAVRFPYVRYHDVDGEDGHTGGVKTETPVAAVTLTIREDTPEQIGGLTWRYAAQSGTLTVGGEFSGQTLIAACYDAGGRMTLVKTMTAQGDLPLDKDSARIRLFLLDKDSRPVCAAVTVKE